MPLAPINTMTPSSEQVLRGQFVSSCEPNTQNTHVGCCQEIDDQIADLSSNPTTLYEEVPAEQANAPHATRSYKETLDRAISILCESQRQCLDNATIYHRAANSNCTDLQAAAEVESGQMITEGTTIAAMSVIFSFLGIAGAVINPQGINEELLKTVKNVCSTTSQALSPSVQGLSALCKGYQEPTKTRHTLAQNNTNKNNTMEQTMDQEARTIQSAAQQIINTIASR